MNYYKHKEKSNLFTVVKGNELKQINTRSGVTSKKQKFLPLAIENYLMITREKIIEDGIDVKSLERFW